MPAGPPCHPLGIRLGVRSVARTRLCSGTNKRCAKAPDRTTPTPQKSLHIAAGGTNKLSRLAVSAA
jgi:hypothetical protein